MAGKKEKRDKKKKKPLSHIGTALFPRAIFTAVPRSPEPPKPVPSPSPKSKRERSPSPLSTAILDAAMVGRAVATPSPNSTLRMTGTGEVSLPSILPPVPGRGPETEAQPFPENGSMARSSMYDYEDSEEEEEHAEEREESDNDNDDYMMQASRGQHVEYHDDPGYAKVEEIEEMMALNKQGTISNRARLGTPDLSPEEDQSMLTHRTGASTKRSQPDTPSRGTGKLPGNSQAEVHRHGYSSGHEEGQPDQIDRQRSNEKKKKKKKKKEKGKKETRKEVDDLYARPLKSNLPLGRTSPTPSNDSDLTGVTSPTADDFSDFIAPPPPWKRKNQSTDIGNQDLSSGRLGKKAHKSKSKKIVEEPLIVKATSDNKQFASGPSLQDNDMYSHLHHSQPPVQQPSYGGSGQSDQLRLTASHLEAELQRVGEERAELQSTLVQRTRQLEEERARSAGLREQAATATAPYHHGSRVQGGDPLSMSLSRLADLEAEVGTLTSTCQQQREGHRSLQEVNRQLRAENQSLRDTVNSNHQEDGEYLRQLKSQAEAVIQENEELKIVIHKLNVQLSRYQAKYDPPTRGDPPGLPARGLAPRWLTDTAYLSPLVRAYEGQLEEKEGAMRTALGAVEELRGSMERVTRENQRLHRALEETGGGSGLGPGRDTDQWLRELEEQARLVLEENQVVMEQVDLHQRRLQDQQRKHAQETLRLSRQLAMKEAERASLEDVLSELQMKHSALRDQHEKSVREREGQMPVQEHLDAITEYKRNIQAAKKKSEVEIESTLSKLTVVECERTDLGVRMAECQAENSQLKGEIHALHHAHKQVQHKLTMVEQELTHSRGRESAANQHLNRVLEIAEQTAAERDSYKKMAHTQAQEKERAVTKMMAGNVARGRMEEKLKMYKLRAAQQMEGVVSRMKDQEELHTARLGQYEREMRHLGHLVKEKQDALDDATANKRKVEDQLEIVWQSASEDSKRLKARIAKSLKASLSADSTNLLPFGSDSDNKGFLSSESD